MRRDLWAALAHRPPCLPSCPTCTNCGTSAAAPSSTCVAPPAPYTKPKLGTCGCPNMASLPGCAESHPVHLLQLAAGTAAPATRCAMIAVHRPRQHFWHRQMRQYVNNAQLVAPRRRLSAAAWADRCERIATDRPGGRRLPEERRRLLRVHASGRACNSDALRQSYAVAQAASAATSACVGFVLASGVRVCGTGAASTMLVLHAPCMHACTCAACAALSAQPCSQRRSGSAGRQPCNSARHHHSAQVTGGGTAPS